MRQNALNRIFLALALLSILPAPSYPAEQHGVEFPGRLCSVPSPDGRYLVLNIDREVDSQVRYLGDNHALYLIDLKASRLTRIHPYGRHAKVLWSGSGSALVINDYVGSDFSDAILFVVPGVAGTSIGVELRKSAQGKRIFSNHHVYIEAVEWGPSDTLTIRVHGYGDSDPNGFEHWYQYSPGGNLKEIPRPH